MTAITRNQQRWFRERRIESKNFVSEPVVKLYAHLADGVLLGAVSFVALLLF